jgi:hypothetical protein
MFSFVDDDIASITVNSDIIQISLDSDINCD